MIERHNNNLRGGGTPEDDSIILRFLDLAKFISLLKERVISLTHPDKFEDQFEGAVCPLADAER